MNNALVEGSSIMRLYEPGERVRAAYRHESLLELPEFWGNPLIQALPPLPTKDEIFRLLATYPVFDEAERLLPPHVRAMRISLINRLFVPMPMQLEIALGLMQIVRLAYTSRNPISPRLWLDPREEYATIREGVLARWDSEAVFDGFSIIGTSGIGKSRSILKALRLLPQVIDHIDYRGVPLDAAQITYLKLDCPPDGSFRTIQENFFKMVDKLVGTNYYKRYARNGAASKSEMIAGMKQVVQDHYVGALVIDEIQVLRELQRRVDKAKPEENPLLNLLVHLVNELRVPVIVVGTARARALLTGKLRMARRFEGLGDITWYQMQEDLDWDLFIEDLLRYNYLRHRGPLDPASSNEYRPASYAEVKHVLYEETQGITDFAIKVFQQAQIRAMEANIEELTVDVIRTVAKDKLRSARPLLLALRDGDVVTLEDIDDIPPIELDKYRAKAVQELHQVRRGTVGGQPHTEPTVTPVALLPTSGQHDATGRASGDASAAKRPRRRRGAGKLRPESRGVLIQLVCDAINKGVAPFEALRDAGEVKDATEFMPVER